MLTSPKHPFISQRTALRNKPARVFMLKLVSENKCQLYNNTFTNSKNSTLQPAIAVNINKTIWPKSDVNQLLISEGDEGKNKLKDCFSLGSIITWIEEKLIFKFFNLSSHLETSSRNKGRTETGPWHLK